MTTNIKDYSTTQSSNISLNGIDTNEGMLPSSLNNALRALMKNTRDWFNDAQWIEYGDGSGAATVAYASSTSFTIAGANVTSIYHVGRRVKIIATTPGTIFGTITAVTFSTNTTVTVVFDSGSLSNEAINVYIGALSKIGSSIPAEIITTASLANGSVTAVKLAVNSVTTDKILNANVTLAKLASDSVDGSKIADDSINSEHYVDASIDSQHIADSQITLAKMASNSVNSAKIVDDSIVNADINSSAAISLSKLENLTTARALVSDGSGDVSVSAVTSTEIGHLDGVTSAIQTQINSKQQTITGSATTIDTESLTANRAVISNGSQKIAVSDVTSTELGYLDGVSSAIQTQLNSKQQTITGAATTIDTENLTASRALTSNGSGKVEVSDVTSTELGFLDGVSSSIQNQLNGLQTNNANLTAIGNLAKTDGNLIVGNGSTWVAENGATARTSLGLGSVATQAANNVSISGGSVTGLGEPSNNADAATKSYVDQSVAGLRTRLIAECASTANVNISNGLEAGDAIDGITLVAGDRILLKNQSTATANGLYIAVANGAGAASRDPEHDTIAELSGGMIVVNQGSANDNKIFLCTTDSNGSIGSTAITYTQVTPSNSGTVTSIATGTGINGGTITSTGTLSIDSTVATLSGTQTLTNKTLNSPKVNENVAVTSTATEINKLDAVSRGSLIYGNPSAATAILTKGGAGTVLTSDGTDIAWQSSAAAAITSTANGANNRIATYTGAAGLNGEANLTFDGSTFVTAGLTITSDPKLSATGSGSNIDLDLLAKGTGHVTIRGNSNPGTIQLNCESNSHGQQLKAQPHSAGMTNEMFLPKGQDSTLVSEVGTATLTNKTLNSPRINQNVVLTSTATELNILDGVTSTTAELNILDGVTSTAAELNILDGVTSTAAELNILDGVTSTAAELNILDGATVVVGELNALDIGSTAVGTAIASKAVILDSNKDYTGIRNLTLAGDVTLANTKKVIFGDAGENIVGDGTNLTISSSGTTTVDSTGDIILDGSNTLQFQAGGSSFLNLINNSGSAQLRNTGQDNDISFLGNDGGSTITALALDMSEGGAATFNSTVTTTGLVIGSTAVTSTAAELNLLDGKAANNLALIGKTEGTNFTDSLIVGHSTTGTLNGASFNTAVGIEALKRVTSGRFNAVLGTQAGVQITTGQGNIALGRKAGFAINSGQYNTFLGNQAGVNLTTGSGNVVIGSAISTDAVNSVRTLKIAGNDGSTTTTWISGDNNGQVKLTAGYIAEVALTDASTITWNAATQPVAKVTLTANRTFAAPTNPLAGQFISILLIQDSGGTNTITWNAVYEFAADTAPTLTATGSLGDLFTFRYNGAKWLEVGRNLALTLS